MIAKISTGSYTAGMVKYNHDKTINSKTREKDAELIGTKNIITPNFESIVSTIQDYNSKNKRVTKPNIHISLNFYKDDLLDNEKILEIGNDYMAQMGFEDQPYAFYRHFDREHPHIHIVSSMINSEGKKINDSHIYFKSQALTRKLEEKYNITKAVCKRGILGENDIHKAIYEHLEHGKHSLTGILNEVLYKVLDSKPTSENEFDKLLESYQVKRFVSFDKDNNPKGHYFDLYPLEYLNEAIPFKKSKGIEGKTLDFNFNHESIQAQLMLNSKGKEQLKNGIMGKIYAVLNPILDNQSSIKLSDLKINFKKKGIELITKRTQTGEDIGSIHGLLFKDIHTKYTYSATEIKLKTKGLLNLLEDDEKRYKTPTYYKENIPKNVSEQKIFIPESQPNNSIISSFFETLNAILTDTHNSFDDQQINNKKKRKKLR
ncbi:hypothetical protein EOD40_17490 [Flavobacterium sufflavum]|uniref:MobA/VirD2-like nuclease domain-containing protein n=1 Tax=Flavobacterium sufflavum TaxID=1921138 RepID=A0A437KJZ1_9FLAO|nr:relaxase/mobilization nuclease domain-containing protein [Flavobacterium sufflavum]RVT71204.1 hypothetical protein EOD40_17490 [Flavobacterium sufflavum]